MPQCISLIELRKPLIKTERLGIAQGREIRDGLAVDDVAHGDLGNLAGTRARYVRDGNDFCGHVTRCGFTPDLLAYFVDEGLIEFHVGTQHHKQDHPHIVLPALTDTDTLENLIQAFDLAIDLGRADAHATGIEHRVGSAMNNHAAVGGDLCIVPMRPDTGVSGKIGLAVALAIGIIPKPDGR